MKYPSFSAPQGALEHFKLQERAGYSLAPLQLEDLTTAGNWDRLKWFYEVGVGKTVCSTVHAMMMGMPLNIIIVPPILIPQWGKWLRRVDPESVVLEYCGPPSKRKLMQPAKAKWIIVSHAIYRDDFDRLFKELAKLHPHVIVDEAHALKSAQSQLFRKVNTMTQSGGLQLLTGTPTSKPGDAYAYVKLTTPDRKSVV